MNVYWWRNEYDIWCCLVCSYEDYCIVLMFVVWFDLVVVWLWWCGLIVVCLYLGVLLYLVVVYLDCVG